MHLSAASCYEHCVSVCDQQRYNKSLLVHHYHDMLPLNLFKTAQLWEATIEVAGKGKGHLIC